MSGTAGKRTTLAAPLAVESAGVTPYTALGAVVVDLGARIGALDQRSRKMMGVMLQMLTEEPDDAPEIAGKVMALEKVQRPMVRNAALHRAMTRPAGGSNLVKGEGA